MVWKACRKMTILFATLCRTHTPRPLCFYLPYIQCHSWWNGNQSHLLSGSIRNRCRVRLLKTRSSLCSAKGSPWRPTHLGIEIQNKSGQKMDPTRNWKLLKFGKLFPSPWPFPSSQCHSTNCSLKSWYGTGGVWLLAMASSQDRIAKISFQAKKWWIYDTATKNDRNNWNNLVLLDGALMKFACTRMASPNHHAAPTFEKRPHGES